MAQVPVYQRQIQPGALPEVRVSPKADISTFGGGEALGYLNATDQLASNVDTVAARTWHEANKAAAMDAAAKTKDLKNETLWNVKSGFLIKRGHDAVAAYAPTLDSFKKTTGEVSDALSNPEQKEFFRRMVEPEVQHLDSVMLEHAAKQGFQAEVDASENMMASSANDGAKNYKTPGAIDNALGQGYAAWKQGLGRSEADDGPVAKQFRLDYASKVNSGVVSNMLTDNNPYEAKKFLASRFAAGQVDASTRDHLDSQIEERINLTEAQKAWSHVRDFKLEDGSVDVARMDSFVKSMHNADPRRAEYIENFLHGKASEAQADYNRAMQAYDHDFSSQLLGYTKDRKPLDEAMKLVDVYGRDNLDKEAKRQAVLQAYAPPKQSNPGAYISLWERTQAGEAKRQDIDQAMQTQQISEPDWEQLRKDYYRVSVEGIDSKNSPAWQRVKIMAEEKFPSDKLSRDKYLYSVYTQAKGMGQDEVIKFATDELQKRPVDWAYFNKPAWQNDLKRMDASSLAMGKLNEDLGGSIVDAMGAGFKRALGRNPIPSDYDSFAKGFGGYDKIQPGTPVYDAMQKLSNANFPLTRANVEALLAPQ